MEGSSSQDNIQQQIKLQTPNRYALIVVGRMGHGKSSFTKMIVSDEEKGRVKAHTGIKSGTWDCKIYRSNKFNDIFDQDIYVVDTPGIDSKSSEKSQTSLSLIVQDIDDLIIRHQAQIIGIVYALDIKQRDQNQGGEGFIFSFLELLRIKYCHKKNFTFCVLTKFDKHYQQQEENQCLIKDFQAEFQKQLYGQMWNRRIQWMSQPEKSVSVYQKKIKGILKQKYENQWIQLSQNFKTIKNESRILTYQFYQNDRKQFEQIFKKNIIKQYSSFSYKREQYKFQIQVNVLDELSIFEKIGLSIGIVTGQVGAAAGVVGVSVIAAEAGVVGATAAGVLSAVALPFTLGAAGIALMGLGLYKLAKRFKGVVLSSMSEQEKQKILSKRLSQKFSIFLINAVSSNILLDSNCFTFENQPYISNVQCFDEQGKEIKIKKIENDTKLRAFLRMGKNKIRFTCKLPTDDCYKQFLKKHSKNFYSKKE